MAKLAKFLQGAAGAAGGGGLDIDEVFSTYLYSGNSSAQTITNGIDLAGEGGLWWLKVRSQAGSHALYDSTRATGSEHFPLFSNNTSAEYDDFDTTPTSTGFTINSTSSGTVNETGQDYTSWTFRKAPKFFDVVTYTGNGVNGREIAHDLGCDVGFMIVKRTDAASSWHCWHNSGTTTNGYIELDQASSYSTYTGLWNNTSPTSTGFTLGTDSVVNASGGTYVAYIFAHNDGDGEFGPDSDADVIKCGSYTTDGSGNATIDLGFEPQWLLRKRTDGSQNWTIYDSMRGWTSGDDDALEPNSAGAESVNGNQYNLTPTGFVTKEHGSYKTYIYVAIRRGSLFPPEDADDVFSIDTWGGGPPAHETSGHVVDLALQKNVTGNSSWSVGDRQLGPKVIYTNQTQTEGNSSNSKFDYQNGWWASSASLTNYTSYMWARAPGFFDLVHYIGNGVQGRNINHNLGVAPDMMWIKNRDSATDWAVYFSGLTHLSVFGSDPDNRGDNPVRLELNTVEQAQFSSSGVWDHTHPTESVFRVGDTGATNGNNQQLVAYLFGSVSGVSKAGAFIHSTGTRSIVDCGFTAGARFVVYKYVNAQTQLGVNDPSNWHVFDTVRGIVGGIDSRLSMNEVDSEITSGNDYVDPNNVGFSLPSSHPSGTYVFYAIA